MGPPELTELDGETAVSFPRKTDEENGCLPISFSGTESCVKGGVFFPMPDPSFFRQLSLGIVSRQFLQIQASLAYQQRNATNCPSLLTARDRKVEIWK